MDGRGGRRDWGENLGRGKEAEATLGRGNCYLSNTQSRQIIPSTFNPTFAAALNFRRLSFAHHCIFLLTRPACPSIY
jgi:hypothetical protein